ncbi:hypothetical protein POSPLADRAFT_1148897 [Postia placenta MAD-698-R-SB12]|uniref:Uncharacterized protein n=1 Tax=Postia placenta MAD-698-R-SB12 TaxID=670580 RepID=A0A1X6MUS2_9APHY|nr:hypothetical protein POSPLADRAFT_1148897 [Postia placenta MAD-698-R-SB12]OSX60069.1 hypothetical protein POSPLADRAFT_1148897 [Postia placenta MAD-698-R-SB12]
MSFGIANRSNQISFLPGPNHPDARPGTRFGPPRLCLGPKVSGWIFETTHGEGGLFLIVWTGDSRLGSRMFDRHCSHGSTRASELTLSYNGVTNAEDYREGLTNKM